MPELNHFGCPCAILVPESLLQPIAPPWSISSSFCSDDLNDLIVRSFPGHSPSHVIQPGPPASAVLKSIPSATSLPLTQQESETLLGLSLWKRCRIFGADMPTVCVKPVSQNESYVLLLVSRFLRACHGTACWTPARFFRCDADSIKCRVAMFLCFKMSLGDVEPPWSLCFGQALVHSGLRPDRQHRMYFEKSSQQCCPSLPGTHLS